MRTIILAILLTTLSSVIVAKNNSTTRKNLRQDVAMLREVQRIAADSDSVAGVVEPCAFDPSVITLRGFVKRASDYRESFVAINNSSFRITGLRLLFRYYGSGGSVIAERTVEVKCDIMPGKEQRLKVKSFDGNHEYHYLYGSRPRLKSAPFDVAYRVLRYDVAVSAK